MDEQKQSLIDRIKQAQNILVTVSSNPSVDQLAAAIGLTVTLNKLDKHGTAVFSGQVPSTIDFLKPEDTLEKNTDSLRDFIIALDKSKADKLRYKVEDEVVRIFITPYKTSLSEKDLDFSQGDFNVDVVVCLGVNEQQDLDAAITAHGRILHDATVACVSTTNQGSLGTINWVDPNASSLSEMTLQLVDGLDKKALDNQIATALLTGIVANTDRFRNEHTSPKAMSAAAELMAAGANQQLIASELDAPVQEPEPEAAPEAPTEGGEATEAAVEPGTLEIDHEEDEAPAEQPEEKPEEAQPEEVPPQVHVDENGQLHTVGEEPELPEISRVHGVGMDGLPPEAAPEVTQRERITEPPRLGDADMTANASPEGFDPSTEELTLPAVNGPILTHNETVLAPATEPIEPAPHVPEYIPQQPLQPVAPPAPVEPTPAPTPAPVVTPTPPPVPQPPVVAEPDPFADNTTLEQIEASVHSPHLAPETTPPPAETGNPQDALEAARKAVEAAHADPTAPADPLQPIAALNAQPLGTDLHAADAPAPPAPAEVPNPGFSEPTPGTSPADETLDMPLPSNPFGPGQQIAPSTAPLPGSTPPSTFPGTLPPINTGDNPNGGVPPVPPPFVPPAAPPR